MKKLLIILFLLISTHGFTEMGDKTAGEWVCTAQEAVGFSYNVDEENYEESHTNYKGDDLAPYRTYILKDTEEKNCQDDPTLEGMIGSCKAFKWKGMEKVLGQIRGSLREDFQYQGDFVRCIDKFDALYCHRPYNFTPISSATAIFLSIGLKNNHFLYTNDSSQANHTQQYFREAHKRANPEYKSSYLQQVIQSIIGTCTKI